MQRRYGALVGLFFLFGIDRIAKWFALNRLPDQGYRLFSDFLTVSLEKNQGIAYSIPLPQGIVIVFIIIAVVLLIGYAVRVFFQNQLPLLLASGLVIIGALSNLIDRFRYGYVIDLFAVSGWSVFNIADVVIVIGAIWLCFIFIFTSRGKKEW